MSWLALCAGPASPVVPYGPSETARLTAPRPARPALDPAAPGAADPLPCGAVLFEYVHALADRPQNILRYRARDPRMAALSLRRDPGGTVHLLMRQGEATLAVDLAMPPVHPGESVHVGYHWRPGGGGTEGLLVVAVPARGLWVARPVARATALSRLDADRLHGAFLRGLPGAEPEAQRHCTAEPCLVFAAVTDEEVPAGPLPGLDGRTRISTPVGPRPLADIVPGDEITADDGLPVRVVWTGTARLPALGRLAPHVVRAPFYGLRQDIILSGAQHLRMRGTEVEYLFLQEEIAVAAADLADNRAVTLWPGGDVATYHQLILDRPALLQAGGAAVPPLDIAPMRTDAVLRNWSPIAAVPDALLPAAPPSLPALRDFEAATLRRMRAA